jgi:hypothetical protein
MNARKIVIIIGLLINGERTHLQDEIEPNKNSPVELDTDIHTHKLIR